MTMATAEVLDTHRKALTINLDTTKFGSFAEIGAGQEVARWFLQVGGASGTVAKTISAYDKEVSDDIYGRGSRYVSKERLDAMLDQEWKQLLSQLEKPRGKTTKFFSFVDTIAARNFTGTNIAHGWVGIRFQEVPGGPANDVIVHINLLDPTNLQQQEAIGVLGVNLIYAVFHERTGVLDFLHGLSQEVVPKRLEIDFVELRGPVFGDGESDPWDRRALHASLVTEGLTEAVLFPKDGVFAPFIDAFYKQAVVLAPGTYNRSAPYHAQMMSTAIDELHKENDDALSTLGLFCISVVPTQFEDPEATSEQLLNKVKALHRLGYGVLLVHERELYRMSGFVQRFTKLPIRFVVGISVLVRVFDYEYSNLAGNLLEMISRLFSQNVRVYTYPMPKAALKDWIDRMRGKGWSSEDMGDMVHADALRPPGAMGHLYQYLLASNFVVPIQNPAEAKAQSLTA
jgi:hypothetical protein